MWLQVFVWTNVFVSLGQTPRSGLAGSYSPRIPQVSLPCEKLPRCLAKRWCRLRSRHQWGLRALCQPVRCGLPPWFPCAPSPERHWRGTVFRCLLALCLSSRIKFLFSSFLFGYQSFLLIGLYKFFTYSRCKTFVSSQVSSPTYCFVFQSITSFEEQKFILMQIVSLLLCGL